MVAHEAGSQACGLLAWRIAADDRGAVRATGLDAMRIRLG